tara:strand:+ start:11 stop:541 length:531 start_codon:yes stop_codon:yes gene_type:complete
MNYTELCTNINNLPEPNFLMTERFNEFDTSSLHFLEPLISLLEKHNLSNGSYIDLFCGKGDVLKKIKSSFTSTEMLGINTIAYDVWSDDTIKFYNKDVSQVLKLESYKFDVAMMFNIHESIWPSRPSVPKDNFISWCKSNTKFLVTNGKPKTKISNMELVDSVSPRKQKYNINLYK